MTQKDRPIISASRGAFIFREMLGIRREYYPDSQFFRTVDVWDQLASDSVVKIKTYKSADTEDFKRRAAVIVFEDQIKLVVDERLLFEARKGGRLYNYILAHELAHLALNHQDRGQIVKHFQLFDSKNGMANIPPTNEEREANWGAVFFQCGVALFGQSVNPLELARRSCSDIESVKKAVAICRLEAFQREFNKPSKSLGRVIL